MEVVENSFRLSTTTYSTDDDSASLREEFDRLNADLDEANEQRAQAAEYGLVLLEEKQSLQSQYEEQSALYESTKRELENSLNTLKQVQSDYEKRLKDVEMQREQLLDEMETRESALINKVDQGEDKMRQLERKLKQSSTEQDYQNEHSTYLSGELERYRREVDQLKDENRQLKQSKTLLAKETDERRRDLGKMERRLETLGQFEENCHTLQEENSTLLRDSQLLQEQFESVYLEKEDLEHQTQEAVQALHEEREIRSLLETKVKEDSVIYPAHPSWTVEEGDTKDDSINRNKKSDLNHGGVERSVLSPLPTRNFDAKFHSTPHSRKAPQDLRSELQDSLASSDASFRDELENLRRKFAEAQEAIGSFKREKRVLEDNVEASSIREAEQLKELERCRERYSRDISERYKVCEELNQKIIIRDEQVEQLRNKLSAATAERTSMEIEVDGLDNEIQRLKVVSGLEVDKIQREHAQEQTRNIQLRSHLSILEEQVDEYTCSIEKLEGIILNSQNELASMSEDIKSLQKVIMTLGTNGKFSSSTGITSKSNGQVLTVSPDLNAGGSDDPVFINGKLEESEDLYYYSLSLKQKKSSVHVHRESQSLRAIINLREQLKLVRSPMERFTKVMLERSLLVHSSKLASPTPPSPDDHGAVRKHALDLEASISKWKAKYVHKTEEINNLRSIMKARATTAEVATSSLRSKLEGRSRAFQMEITKLRYQIKMLKKERDEHLSLRTMYAKRCEDYIDEITKARKLIDKRKQAHDELMVALQRTIQRKLELSTELEEYKMDRERNIVIPTLLGSSRV